MSTDVTQSLIVRKLGQQDYQSCWKAMQTFTDTRTEETLDELWLLEHPPIFTLGQNGDVQHLHRRGTIPVLKIDRGGQITYHGPGQLVVYTLVDLKRKSFSIRQFITRLEQAIIQFLAADNIQAEARCKAPGVYVNDKKLCSIGLRVRRGFAFHGLALNVAMDLAPFQDINPCGYAGLQMTQLAELGLASNLEKTEERLLPFLMKQLDYQKCVEVPYEK